MFFLIENERIRKGEKVWTLSLLSDLPNSLTKNWIILTGFRLIENLAVPILVLS